MERVVAIIEARMASSRLPKKVMLPLGNIPVIEFIINRLKKSKEIHEICVATTKNEEDDVLADFLKGIGIQVYRGSDWNVLERVIEAGKALRADILVEVTGDCPFVDSELLDYMLDLLRSNDLEYVSNNFKVTYADGFDLQVYYYETLKRLADMNVSHLEKEHVTMKIRQEPQLFKTLNLIAPEKFRRPNYSVTLDTYEDYEVIKVIFEHMKAQYNDRYGIAEITDFLDKNPQISKMNGNVPRKGFS